MGLTYVEGTVAGKKGKKAAVKFMVDSGAIYSLLPRKDWQAIGLKPKRTIIRGNTMASAKSNGNGRLNEAMTNLIQAQACLAQAQATMVQNQAAFLARASEIDARVAENDVRFKETQRENAERFARIETLLLEHGRILKALPEVMREKMGFRPS